MTYLLKDIAGDEQGATAVEYGLILALIFIAMLGAVQAFGTNAANMWSDTATKVNTASTASA